MKVGGRKEALKSPLVGNTLEIFHGAWEGWCLQSLNFFAPCRTFFVQEPTGRPTHMFRPPHLTLKRDLKKRPRHDKVS